jgi:hypothetical protein
MPRTRCLWLVPLTWPLSGCIAGTLATDSGPARNSLTGRPWRVPQIHVGAEVHLELTLWRVWPRWLVRGAEAADYALVAIGDERVAAALERDGRFGCTYRFDRFRPGQRVPLEAVAYRQQGARDFMQVGGKWLRGSSAADPPDLRVASAHLTVELYQSFVLLKVARASADLEFASARLELRRADGSVSAVYLDRPGRPGFDVHGPDDDGYYRVRYAPSGVQVNASGSTDVQLIVYDSAGHPHTVRGRISMP